MQKPPKYILLLQYGTMANILFRDLIDDESVEVFYVSRPIDNKPLNYIRSVHTSIRATKYFEPPLKSVWYLNDLLKIMSNNACLIFLMDSMIHVGMRTIMQIKRYKPSARLILVLLDSIHAHSLTMPYAKPYIFSGIWDAILSYDVSDCKEFNFKNLGFNYYSKLNDVVASEKKSHLYYAGRIKNEPTRLKILNNIFEICSRADIKCNFLLTGTKDSGTSEKGYKISKNNIPYIDVLKDVLSTNCILEIQQPGQQAQTARYMEAVCYNRKLLTNNVYVKNLPHYNPDYIHVFSRAEDIDLDWIREVKRIDYGYHNEFSPIKILNIIESSLL